MRISFTPRLLVCALFICGFSAAPAFSQVAMTNISWEVSKLAGKNRLPFVPVAELRAAPEVRFSDNLRALVTLRNPSVKPVEGLVLRYALRFRLVKEGDAPEKAFWGVPFYFEEVRVSKVNPSSEKQARIIRFDLTAQLNRLKGSGFLPSALKLEVMLSPRPGDEPASIIRESTLEILKP